MAAIVWLVAGLVLAAAEAITGDLFLLMLAGGALAAAGTTGFTDWPSYVDGIVFGVVSILLVVGVRPVLRRKLDRGPHLSTNASALEGKAAVVVESVDGAAGRVKLSGEIWSARSLDESSFDVGARVLVVHIDGATAVVTKEL